MDLKKLSIGILILHIYCDSKEEVKRKEKKSE